MASLSTYECVCNYEWAAGGSGRVCACTVTRQATSQTKWKKILTRKMTWLEWWSWICTYVKNETSYSSGNSYAQIQASIMRQVEAGRIKFRLIPWSRRVSINKGYQSQMHTLVNLGIHGWMDKWTDWWIHAWMDGWMEATIKVSITVRMDAMIKTHCVGTRWARLAPRLDVHKCRMRYNVWFIKSASWMCTKTLQYTLIYSHDRRTKYHTTHIMSLLHSRLAV